MALSSRSQAVMLLTGSLGKPDKSGPKPLTVGEWGRFAAWLRRRNLDPSALVQGDVTGLLAGWRDRSVTQSRIERLLDRGGALGLAMERWERAGLWVVTRADLEYPQRLKRRLREASPPVLFGCGSRELLAGGGLAVVGSRNADCDDLEFAANLGDSAARQGLSIVSGGSRGVDESGMGGALGVEGTAIGVLADSLLRKAMSARYRSYLRAGDLTLISPFNPEAGFNVGNAMSRNRYVYCLADAAVVVCSTPDRGGTWHGAIENLRHDWVPLWVKPAAGGESGNAALLGRGARLLPDDLTSLAGLYLGSARADESPETPASDGVSLAATDTETGVPEPDSATAGTQQDLVEVGETAAEQAAEPVAEGFFRLFLIRLQEITRVAPTNAEDIAQRLELKRSQVNAWLKRGVGEGQIRKLTRPVRYQSTDATGAQPSLLDGLE